MLMLDSLNKSKINVQLFIKYVEDVNLATGLILVGWYLKEGDDGRRKLLWFKEKDKQDRYSGAVNDMRTFPWIKEEADRLIPGLMFTVDLPRNHIEEKCPMLVLKLSQDVDTNAGTVRIRHSYYEI